MDRILQGAPATLSNTWYENGVAVDPGVVTIGITGADGSEIVAAGTATTGTGVGARGYTLPAGETGQLDRLKITWTSPSKGAAVEYIDIAGGFLFSLSEALADPALSNQSPASLAAARTAAEEAIERACGVAFVPRYSRETVNGNDRIRIRLGWSKIRTIRAVSVDGSAYGPSDLALVKPMLSSIDFARTWPLGIHNIVVDYEHGFDGPPAEVSRAALRLAKHRITQAAGVGFDERVVRAQAGEESFTFASPSRYGGFGLPEVDSVVSAYRYNARLA